MTTEPLQHIARARPPWRADDGRTECGRAANDVQRVIARDDAQALIREHGKQRAAFILCMTCAETAGRYAVWTTSPSDVLMRDGSSLWRLYSQKGPSLLDRELLAIAALIEAHRDEFDGFLTDLAETTSLAERRSAKAKR